MHRLALALAILAMCLVPTGAAHAQLGAPDVPSPLTEPPPPPPVEDVDEGLSSLQQILIFVGAGLVLATIAFVIVRDAKRAAPDKPQRKSTAPGPGGKPAGSKTSGSKASVPGATAPAAATDTSASAVRARERQRAKRAKAKAKAARQQRKRNRPH